MRWIGKTALTALCLLGGIWVALATVEAAETKDVSIVPADSTAEQACIDAMLKAVRDGVNNCKDRTAALTRFGRVYEVKIENTDGLTVTGSLDGAVAHYTWDDAPARLLCDLARLFRMSKADAWIGMGLKALQEGDRSTSRFAFASAARASKKDKPAIDAFLAERIQVQVPDGGFAEKAGLLVTGDELAMLEQAMARLGRLANAIGKAPAALNAKAHAEIASLKEWLSTIGNAPLACEHVRIALAETTGSDLASLEAACGLKEAAQAGNKKGLSPLKIKLNEGRETTLALINDEVKWPYPYGPNDAEVRSQVEQALSALRKIWGDQTAIKGKLKGKSIDAYTERMETLMTFASEAGVPDEWLPDHEYTQYLLMLARAGEVNIRNFTLDANERALYVTNASIVSENRAMEAKYAKQPTAPSIAAWQLLHLTCDYRMMFGLNALKMNFKLCWASQHHSEYIIEHNNGKAEHIIQGEPRGAQPKDRCTTEGYPRTLVGENIASGPAEAQKALNGWSMSSGHSRGMINPKWVVFGAGKHDAIWTELFGALDEGEKNYESKGGE